jgi:pimeloyl-ACP methyl ester carboxylesterase
VPRRPIVLLHGYSASAKSLHGWRELLLETGYDAAEIRLGQYISLSNEITIKDVAEAFDRALRADGGLDEDQEFDAIVHSTGGLVIREWLATYASRRERVKHIIGLAPAMFGSPLAHQGRSWLGAVFKGHKDVLSPDFMEAGTRVLSGLELGSSYTWQLAERDLLGSEPTYGDSAATPWPFIFIGRDGYGGLRSLFTNPDGSDGTVRWAAAGLSTRKLHVDLRRTPAGEAPERVRPAAWSNVNSPLVLVPGCNHGTIASDPPRELVEMVLEALEVEDFDAYQEWSRRHADPPADEDRWQQFVVRAVDERGDPVPDYYLDIGTKEHGEFHVLDDFALDVHAFTDDPSYRCFHVNLTKLAPSARTTLALRLIAQSGTELVAYYGADSETFTPTGEPSGSGKWDAQLDLTPWLHDEAVDFFSPYTTTLVEIMLNREPMPAIGATTLLGFVPDPENG